MKSKQKQLVLPFECPAGFIGYRYGRFTFHEPIEIRRRNEKKAKVNKSEVKKNLEKRQRSER